MKTRTILIDGNFLIQRSYNGAKNAYTTSYGYIGALYSFMTTLRKLIKNNSTNKVIVCWDSEQGGFLRYKIDRAYKANRKNKNWYEKIELTNKQIDFEKNKEKSILKQRKRIQSYLEELFIRQIEVDKVEADDLIASYCLDNHNKEDILIYTNDRDFAQLLDLNISIKFDNIEDIINKQNFMFHFPYNYFNALTVKVICGDTSDNISGINSLKEKGLLKHFPNLKFKKYSVNDIYKGAKKINNKRVKEGKKPLLGLKNLTEGREILEKNYKLINLREPFLTDEAIEELQQVEIPLSPEGRSSNNLYKMMLEDGFLEQYNGTFVNYIEPFYPIITSEKKKFKEYIKNFE